MKSITLKSLQLINFKGQRNLNIPFTGHNTDIYGDNGTGKTSIFDAFTFLLFGKDSNDRKDFEVKTLGADGKVIPEIDHEVAAMLEVDGDTIAIRRLLKENWVKKKGNLEKEFKGNVTEYYWNGVPVNQTEFNAKVGGILNEQVFKMITNPLAFNSLKWQERRQVLIKMAGETPDAELAAGNTEYMNLLAQLTQGKTLEDFKKQISASIKKAKDDIKEIQPRIAEVERGKPESFDFTGLKKDLEAKESELAQIDAQLQDAGKAFDAKLQEINAKKLQANSLKAETQAIRQAAEREADIRLKPDDSILAGHRTMLTQKENELVTAKGGVKTLSDKQDGINKQIALLSGQMTAKREQWAEENAKVLTFNDNDFCCPTCKRAFEASDVDGKKLELQTNFNTAKAAALYNIQTQGQQLAAEKTNLEAERDNLSVRIGTGQGMVEALETEITALKGTVEIEAGKLNDVGDMPGRESIIDSILLKHDSYTEMLIQITDIESRIEEVPTVDNGELKSKRNGLVFDIDGIKTKLRNEAQIKAADTRKAELLAEENALAQQIADVERIHFTIENFNKLKIDALETKINSKFNFVQFRMFEDQINGGVAECCEPMIGGVPFTDANTASRINAGLDIINTLCDFYQVTAPVFLDNRESVVKLIDTKSQLVNLIVSEVDKELRVA